MSVNDTLEPGRPTTVMLNTTEAAHYIKAKPRTLQTWVRQGKVQAYASCGISRHVWLFRQSDLDAAILAKPAVLSEIGRTQ